VPIAGLDFLLRPTVLTGVTRRAPDYGLGLSFVLASPTYRPAKASSEYGDIIIE
jgi:hypothetical protein